MITMVYRSERPGPPPFTVKRISRRSASRRGGLRPKSPKRRVKKADRAGELQHYLCNCIDQWNASHPVTVFELLKVLEKMRFELTEVFLSTDDNKRTTLR